MYLYGTPGTGKTHAALGLGRELHDAGAEVHYRYLPEAETGWVGHRSSTYVDSVVFPETFANPVNRNPKSVLILDDYSPKRQPQVISGVDAAAQYGGLVIITSNYNDPFKLTKTPLQPSSSIEILAAEQAEQVNPESMRQLRQAEAEETAELSASFRSRVANNFAFLNFTGRDRRETQSFWD